ncbi:RluA family pseudouridine synthase [Gracilimonas mengyeensis]|uniref:Ribosomal large subunit pseudouridine synthase D n=1 Tax=Gracilimonas mengyeensis TaxID=1302730 RepID=A0A521EPX9_9BACT|nr:RNA pseudouridine synthase [Gracilimonas mengyeensis]SMO85967.1 ribosomal large subunit pseudouridine synthase D [Gracilimonas mengyeensis]
MSTSFTGTKPNIPIIFEDNHLLVIDKPAGLLSQEDHTGNPDVLNLCKQYIKKKYNKPGNVYLGLVHRLDQPVSGVMVLAKTSKAASRLSYQIRKRTINKTYWALVEGKTPVYGELVHFLDKDKRTNTVKAYKSPRGKAKESRLKYITIKTNKNYSVVEVDLITGRPHQIRVQFASEGFPLWGDYRYGDSSKPDGRDIALRAVKLELEHPTQKELMTFKALKPEGKPWNMFDY